uniref:Non-specific serine/threonine protein kinase n=1 Tax=Eptatretus burgeri TaxID=7764 RepID=A0A8C4NJ03_EPTBU
MLEPPELPEETLMEREHTDTLHDLSLVLDFARGLMIVGDARSGETGDLADYQQSSVTDQISQFSRNWGAAERLLLYMKAAEVVGSVLHLARERVNEGRLSPTAAVKKVVRCLNEEFRRCVAVCRSLSVDLAPFLAGKQRLMSGTGVGGSVTAEYIAYSHALDLVRSAALDEMFRGDCGVRERYHLAARLLEGLALILPTAHDAQLLHQYKQHVEQHLSAMEHP